MNDQPENVNTTESLPAEAPAKPAFKPHTVLVVVSIVIVLASLVRVVMIASKQGLDSYNIGRDVGASIGLILWPFVFGWIAFLLFRRSQRAGNIVFILVLLLGLLGSASAALRQTRAESEKLMKESAALSQQARDAADRGDSEKTAALANQAMEKAEESAKRATGYGAVTGEYGASVGKRINELMRVYLASVGEFTKAGGQSCTGLTDTEAFDKRLGVLDDAIAKHDAVLAYLNSIATTMPKDLAVKGVPPEHIAKFVHGFMSEGKMDKVIRIHELEHDMLNIFGAKLDILKNSLGKWTCKDGDIDVHADFPDDALKEFNSLQVELQAALKEQGELTAAVQKKS